MNLSPNSQTHLYGLENQFNELVKLYKKDILPSKILLSGLKGIGKSTLAYHLINYILSLNEDYQYELDKLTINPENRSYKLIQNNTNPNFYLIDVNLDKKNIDINQIRTLIHNLNKSSFNLKPRFVLIDNIEYLNINSINALLKILEEPNENIHFILIHNNKKILSTLLSRCINFKISLDNQKIKEINDSLFEKKTSELINQDLIDYYFTPGRIFNLLKFSNDKEIDLKKINLRDFLLLLINNSYYKSDDKVKSLLYEMIELFILKNISLISATINKVLFSIISYWFKNLQPNLIKDDLTNGAL